MTTPEGILWDVKWPDWMGEQPRRCAPWSVDEEQVMLTRFERGDGIKKIAAAHGRDESAIKSRLIRVGVLEEEVVSRETPDELRAEVAELKRQVRMLNATVYGRRDKRRFG